MKTNARVLGFIALAVIVVVVGWIAFRSLKHRGSEPIVIRVLGEDSSNLRAMQKLAPVFEKELAGRGVSVEIKFEAVSFEDAGDLAFQDFKNRAGKYDIVLQYNFSLADYASNNYVFRTKELAPLVPQGEPEEVEKSLFPKVWREVGWYYAHGSHADQAIEAVGYPFAANTMLLVYNRRFFDDPKIQARYQNAFHKKLEPPATWNDFKQQAAFFTTASDAHCGVALEGKTDGWLYYEWMNFLYSMGGTVMQKQYGWQGGPEENLQLNTPVAIQAADFYKSLKPYACGDFFNIDAPAQRELLWRGDVPMALMWSDYLFELVQKSTSYKQSFGFAPVPGGRSLIGGGSYYISRQSHHPDIAAQFVFFLLRPKNQVELAKIGLCSPVETIYQDRQVLSAVPYMKALGESLKRASYMLEAGPDSKLISSKIEEALQKLWKGAPTGATLNELQQTLTEERVDLFRRLEEANQSK